MLKKIYLIIVFACLTGLSYNYTTDSLAVQALLDTNELDEIAVKDVCDSSSGRIVRLDLNQTDLVLLTDTIGTLTSLTDLILAENQLTELPNALGKLIHLNTLDLSENQLTTLPDSIGNLVSLTELLVANNNLTNLPYNIGNLASLIVLDVSANQLTNLPGTLGLLGNLNTLELSYNELNELPDSMSLLNGLRELNLSENNLVNLPITFGQLYLLTDLDLSWNQITTLPDTISGLTKLNWFDLSHNQITSVPNALGTLSGLKTLNLAYNLLTSLPDSITSLDSLTQNSVDLGHNKLANLNGDVLNWANNHDPDWATTQDITQIDTKVIGSPLQTDGNLLTITLKNHHPYITEISFCLPQSSFVKLEIFTFNGRLIDLVINEVKTAGEHHLQWHHIPGKYVCRFWLDKNLQFQKIW